MSNRRTSKIVTCPCGRATVNIRAKPMARFYCHCTICQAISRQAYADDCVQLASDIHIPNESAIEFCSPNRGVCKNCKSPVVTFFSPVPLLHFVLLPSANYPTDIALPPPKAHMFYHRRIADIHDNLPKFEGYWRSQVATAFAITMSLFSRFRNSPNE